MLKNYDGVADYNHYEEKRLAWQPWPLPISSGSFGMNYDEDDVTEDDIRACPELEDLLEAKEHPDPLYDYLWDENGLDEDLWLSELNDILNQIRIDDEPVWEIERIIGYSFGNQNLLRQAFTRRAFANEHKLRGCSEELEFIGDQVISYWLIRMMTAHFTDMVSSNTEAPFWTKYREGEMTRIRSHFTCKEHLAKRTEELGLNRFILYGTNELESENAKEDLMEALIGAIAIDSEWNDAVVEDAIDRLLAVQFEHVSDILQPDFYELLNAWYQKHYHQIPDYEVYSEKGGYHCILTGYDFDRVEYSAETRSKARLIAAELAVGRLKKAGLWLNLKDAHMIPEADLAINQLQELFQKKYVDRPEYEFDEMMDRQWGCSCSCSGYIGYDRAPTKTEAKKRAAYKVLCRMLAGTGTEADLHDNLPEDIQNRRD